MKAIKTLVLSMGLLLIAGLGLLGYGLYSKAGQSGKSQPRTVTQTGAFSVTVPVPVGSRVDQMLAVGDRLVVRLGGAAGDRLLVLDPNDGHQLGSFALQPEAPTGGK